MKKHRKQAGTGGAGHGHAHGATRGAPAEFSAEHADAFQVVDEIVALREALATMEKRPFSVASRAPAAVRRLLELIENINLRLADLESAD
jgi:hypothetical protein